MSDWPETRTMASTITRPVLVSAILLTVSLGLGSGSSILDNKVQQYNVTEGHMFELRCNTSYTIVYWSNNAGFRETGKELSFFRITRQQAGQYTCYKTEVFKQPEVLETIFINVQYAPALQPAGLPTPVHENGTFSLVVMVDGNPAPNVSMVSREGGRPVYTRPGARGNINVTVGQLQCADGGVYDLWAGNKIGNDTVMEEILVYCPPAPSPRVPCHDMFKPRLGVNLTLQAVTMGYPYPNFTWTLNGERLYTANSSHFESDVVLWNFRPKEFGDYVLTMKNDLGETNHTFEVMADGPPGPVTDLAVVGVGETQVNLTWMSGYDYGMNQSYVVKAYNNSKYTVLATFPAAPGDHGFVSVSHVISGLVGGARYNLTVTSQSSKGASTPPDHSVIFTTAPYSTHTVIEGEGVFLVCNGTLPGDRVYWTTYDGTIVSNTKHTSPYSTHTVIEGEGVFLVCNGTLPGDRVYWTTYDGTHVSETKQLSIFNTTRNDAGMYLCNEIVMSSIVTKETIYLDVQYPEKILDLKVLHDDVLVNASYVITVTVEGNPVPMTSLSAGGHVVFETNETGVFNASIHHVTCEEFGAVELTCSNKLHHETKTEMMLVHCPPSPKSGIHYKFQPRLGENVTLKIENIGYPFPEYTWSYNGKVLKNETADNEDELEVMDVKISDFGTYTLTMKNELGTSTEMFMIQADGPPDPVTKLGVNNVTVSSANITFVSGYDYNDTQNFIVQSYNGQGYDDIASFADMSTSHRPVNVSHVVDRLAYGTAYNLSVRANNSRGLGPRSPAFILFTTKVPYTSYEVLEGEDFLVRCNASSNYTNVHWENRAGQRKGNGSVLDLKDITRMESGFYDCIGNSGSTLRHKLQDLFIDVQYPGKILNMSMSDDHLHANESFYVEIEVEGNPPPIVTFTKLRDGSVIFSRNESGVFNISLDPVACTDQSNYKLSCGNTVGVEVKEQELYVFCPPTVDPKAHIVHEFYPRLGNVTTVNIENYGYPYPNYTWTHNAGTLQHNDTKQSSKITVNVAVEDFGQYAVDMDNEFGDVKVSFQLIPKGPPEPVSGLKKDNATYNSVTLTWMSGYNYGSQQIFMVINEDGTILQNFTDTTTKSHESGVYTVTGLNSATQYNMTVVARNKDGNSMRPAGSVNFTTAAAPAPQTSGPNKKAIIGGVVGTVCFLAVLVIVGIFLKRRRDKRNNYQDLDDDEYN